MNASILDPRSKLITAIASSVLLMFLDTWVALAIAFVILMMVVLALSLGRPWLGFLKTLGFAVITFFMIAWASFDLLTGIFTALRLLTLATVFFIFFQTTTPEALSNSLIKMGIPYTFAFVLSASMQFIHVLVRSAARIRDAQRARGIPLDTKFEVLRHLPALTGPLLIQAFKLADELAEAMEARGFSAPGRHFRYEPRLRLVDWLVIGVSISASVFIIWPK